MQGKLARRSRVELNFAFNFDANEATFYITMSGISDVILLTTLYYASFDIMISIILLKLKHTI